MQRVHKEEKVTKQDCKLCDMSGICNAEHNIQPYQCPKGTQLWAKLHSKSVAPWLNK